MNAIFRRAVLKQYLLLWDLCSLDLWNRPQTKCRMSLTVFDDIQGGKAPAAAINSKKHVNTLIFIIWDNIDSEKGACGRHNNKQHAVNYLIHELTNSLSS